MSVDWTIIGSSWARLQNSRGDLVAGSFQCWPSLRKSAFDCVSRLTGRRARCQRRPTVRKVATSQTGKRRHTALRWAAWYRDIRPSAGPYRFVRYGVRFLGGRRTNLCGMVV